MSLLIFGGSFNPVHSGHCALADAARVQFGFDKVLFVPSANPPHKILDSDPGGHHRLEMLKILCEQNNTFLTDDCELRRSGKSFTIDTLEDVIRRYSLREKPGLLLGDDLATDFKTWKQCDRIVQLARLILGSRNPGSTRFVDFPFEYADNPTLAISSSMIRKRISENGSYRYLLPDSVYRYIIREKLYACS